MYQSQQRTSRHSHSRPPSVPFQEISISQPSRIGLETLENTQQNSENPFFKMLDNFTIEYFKFLFY